jgi:hypothetical protein
MLALKMELARMKRTCSNSEPAISDHLCCPVLTVLTPSLICLAGDRRLMKQRSYRHWVRAMGFSQRAVAILQRNTRARPPFRPRGCGAGRLAAGLRSSPSLYRSTSLISPPLLFCPALPTALAPVSSLSPLPFPLHHNSPLPSLPALPPLLPTLPHLLRCRPPLPSFCPQAPTAT